MTTDTDLGYSPDVIRFWLLSWEALIAACEGGTYAPGQGSGRGKRDTLFCIKADLESAADELPAHWTSTARIYALQGRMTEFDRRRARQNTATAVGQPMNVALERMARVLGWEDPA